MRQTWNKAVHSLNTGVLGLSRFTFGKPAFAIILLAILANLVALPGKIRLARQLKQNADKQEALRNEVAEIEEKYRPEEGQHASFEQTRQKGEELKTLYQKNSFNFAPGAGLMLVSLGGIVAAQAVGGIKKDERFAEGGVLWFKDLTKPDRFLVLPAAYAGLLVAKSFIKPLQANQRQTPMIPGLEQVEKLANYTKFLPVVFFLGSIAVNKRPTAAESLYSVTQAGVELVEDYFVRKMVAGE